MSSSSGSSKEARRRIQAARKRVRYARERGGDVVRAEKILQRAEEALEAGDASRAQDLATEARQEAEEARKRARARQLIANAERKVRKAEERGARVPEAWEHLARAEEALKDDLYADVQKRARQARDAAEEARRRKVAEDNIHRTEKILEAEAAEGSDLAEANPLMEDAWRAVEEGKFGAVPKLLHKASRVAERAKKSREALEALEALEAEIRELKAMKADPEAAEKARDKAKEALGKENWQALRKHIQTGTRAARKARKERERELTLTVVEQLVERAGTGGVSALGARELLEEVEGALGKGRYTDIDTLVEAKFEAEATRKENEILRGIAGLREAMAEVRIAGLEVSGARALLDEAEAALRDQRMSEADALLAKAESATEELREALKASASRALDDLQRELEQLEDLEADAPQAVELAARAEEALEGDDAFRALDLARMGLAACKAARRAHFDALAAQEIEEMRVAAARKEAGSRLAEARELSALLEQADLDHAALDEAVARAEEALEGEDGGTLAIRLGVVEELTAAQRRALEGRLGEWVAALDEAIDDVPAEEDRTRLREALADVRRALTRGALDVALEASLALEEEVLDVLEADEEGEGETVPVPPDELKRVSAQFVRVKQLLDRIRAAGIDVTESEERFREVEAALQARRLREASGLLEELEETATAVQSSLAQAARDFIAAARLQLQKTAKTWAPLPDAEGMLEQAESFFEAGRYDEAIELARLVERKTRARKERIIDEAHGEVADRIAGYRARLAALRDVMKDLGRADIAIEGSEKAVRRVEGALEEADFETVEEHLGSLEDMAEVLTSGLKVAAQDLLASVDEELEAAEQEGLPVPRGHHVIDTARDALAEGRYVEALEYCKVIEDIVVDVRNKAALEGLRERVDTLRDEFQAMEGEGARWERAQALLQDVEAAAREGHLERAQALADGLQGVLDDVRGATPAEGAAPLRVEEAVELLREAQRALADGEVRALADLLTQARLHLGAEAPEASAELLEQVTRALEVAREADLPVDRAREVFTEAHALLEEDADAALEALRRAWDLVREAAQDLPEEARPTLVLEMPEEGLEEGRWARFQVYLRNGGKLPAQDVQVRLRGDVEVRPPDPIPELGPGEQRKVDVEVKPRGEGELPVEVEMTYRGFFDDRPVATTERRQVTAAPRGTYLVEDVFLVHSDGRLITHDTRKPEDEIDEDIFSGMLTVVQDFVKDSFRQRTNLGLRRLEFGDSKILIERGAHIYLAAVLSGSEPDLLPLYMVELINEIERKFGPKLEKWSGLLSELQGIDAIVGKLCYFSSDAIPEGPEGAEAGLGLATSLLRGGKALGLDLQESESALEAAREAVEEDTERAWALVQDAVEKAMKSQQDLQERLESALQELEGDLEGLVRFGRSLEGGSRELERARQAMARGDYDLAARVVTSLDETLSVLKEEVLTEKAGLTLEKLSLTLSSLEREGADTSEAATHLEGAKEALEQGRLADLARHLEDADAASHAIRKAFLLEKQKEELSQIQEAYERGRAAGRVPEDAAELVDRAADALERADLDELEVLVGMAREAVLAAGGLAEPDALEGEPRVALRAPSAPLQVGSWGRYKIQVTNEGDRPAENVELAFAGDVEVKGDTRVGRLEPGETRTVEVGLRPTAPGDAAVDLQVSYGGTEQEAPQVTHYLRDLRAAPPDTYLVEDVLLFLPDGQLAVHETRTFREELDRESLQNMVQAVQEFVSDAFKRKAQVGIKRMEFGDSRLLLERGRRSTLAAIVVGEEPDLLPVYMLQVLQEVEEVHGDLLDAWGEDTEPPEALRATVRKVLLVTDADDADLGPLARSPVAALRGLPKERRAARVEALLPDIGRALAEEGPDAGMEVVQAALEGGPGKTGTSVEIDDESLKEYIEVVKEIDRAVRKARGKAGLEFHWPVSRLAIRAKTPTVGAAATNFKAMITSHANAKEVDVLQAGEIWKGVDLKMTIHQEALSKAYKVWAKKIELILRSQDPWKIKAGIERGGYEMGIEGQVIEVRPDMVSFQAIVPPHVVAQEFPDGMVFLDTRMTEETEAEGFANEVVKIVLEARKDLGLGDTEPVTLKLVAGDKMRRLLGLKKAYILQEAHARDLVFVADAGEEGYVADVELGEEAFTIAIVPAG